MEVDGFGTQTLVVTANGEGAWQADCMRPPGLAPGRHRVRLRTLHSALSNAVEFEMSDESGVGVTVPSDSLPAVAPELCSAQFQPPGDRRITIGRAGSLICYLRTTAETLGTADVYLDIDGNITQSHTMSSLGDGVWQANLLLDEAMPGNLQLRLRLGNGPWSNTITASPVA